MKRKTKGEKRENYEGKKKELIRCLFRFTGESIFNGLLSIHVSVEWVLFTKIVEDSQ